jgi:hypothetical protein
VTYRWIPLETTAYGTWVARPARTTGFAAGGDGAELGHRVRSVLGVTTVSWARGRRARGRLRIKPVTVQAFSQRSRKVTACAWAAAQAPGKVAVCTKCPNMPVAGIWLPAWTNAVAWCRATTWAHRTKGGRIETLPGPGSDPV